MRFLFALMLLAVCQPVNAAAIAHTDHLRATLIADKAAIAPGGTVTLAVVQDIIPSWHTYWQNPGDSGLAPSLAWTLPQGFTAGPILWPPPHRLAVGPLVNYGYSDHVVLLTDIAVPKTAAVGSTVPIFVRFKWLVCQEACIPEEATLDLALPVAAAPQDDIAQFEMFSKARADLPTPLLDRAHFSTDANGMTLYIGGKKPDDALFFPFKSAVIDASADQTLREQGSGFTLFLAKGDMKPPADHLEGVLEVFHSAEAMRAHMMTATYRPSSSRTDEPETSPVPALDLIGAALLALAGGMILNLMPCVFPVLSFKLLAVTRQAHGERRHAVAGGFAYAAGILVCFGVLAAVLIALKAAGTAVGWGFQLQSPLFVLVLAWLIFAMGLSLSGFFTVGGRFTAAGSGLAAKPGHAGSFFTGVLAAVVATPCSAPFMGTAIGYATAQPWPVAAVVIECVGLGLALPYLLLTLTPGLIRLLPRPGVWMDTFKQFLAFPLYASSVWLVWVLSIQSGAMGILVALSGCVLIAFAVWALHVTGGDSSFRRRFGQAVALAALAGMTSAAVMLAHAPQQVQGVITEEGWEPFTAARLAELRKSDTPVFIDMTAAWCITCMVNERVALRPPELAEMKRHGVVLLRGDWTNQNPEITAFLSGFGRNGVPIYVYYPGDGKPPVVLPQILTPDIVLSAVRAH